MHGVMHETLLGGALELVEYRGVSYKNEQPGMRVSVCGKGVEAQHGRSCFN